MTNQQKLERLEKLIKITQDPAKLARLEEDKKALEFAIKQAKKG
jgi:hypothetical protein